MPIVQSNSGGPPSGITINNYNQQGEPLLSSRRELINSIINFTHDNHLDGIEINEIVLSFQDIQYHLEFCKDLRQKLRTLNRTDFIISLNVVSQAPNAAIKDLLKFVDFVSIQTNLYYSFGSNEAIGPRIPLYRSHSDAKIRNLNQQMKSYSCISGSPSKLNIMVEFRGYHWKNMIPPKNSSDTLWMTAETKNEIVRGGIIPWKDLRESRVWNISKASWNHETKTPYIWNPENRTYLVFENERSIKEKMKYAIYKNFGGVLIRLLPEDDDEDSLLNIVSSKQWCLSEVSDEVNYECD